VLAEIPRAWGEFAEQFAAAVSIPRPAFAYFLAQTLVGAGPIERERMHAYAEKAMREASDATTYTDVDEAYEAAVHAAVDAAYDEPQLRSAWDDLVAAVTPHGWTNALGQKLVQLTMPGVPDVYQGTELWDDSLVDPGQPAPRSTSTSAGRCWRGAAEPPGRRRHRRGEAVGDQPGPARPPRPPRSCSPPTAPLRASGPAADHLVAFDRGGAVTLATRLPVRLAARGGWLDTAARAAGPLRRRPHRRELEGAVPVAEVLDRYPVALLLPA
jgi:(1->4)-alpha-D-glucan 1-alpha-D-glucosylmutase